MLKRVLIALAPLGGGHQSMAQAISEALSELDANVVVSTVNVFSAECSAFPLTAIPRLYVLFTVSYPALWCALYYGTNGRVRYTLVERLVQPLIRSRLKVVLRAIQPDVIVSVFPALGYTIQRAIQELGWHTPLGIVVADLVSIHQAWLCRDAAWYAVPTDEAWRSLVSAGVDSGSIHVFGLPVRREFLRPPDDRYGLRRELGLPIENFVVLVAGRGEGTGRLEDMVDALLASHLPCYLVVVTGRNEWLRRSLAHKTQGLPCRVLGYVTNTARWMWASDALVTKAGPSTVVEAVHCGLPIVLTWAIPGQEEGNVSFVLSNKLGVMAKEPQDVVTSVAKLLTDQALVAEIRSAMQRVRRPHAALDIARLILASC